MSWRRFVRRAQWDRERAEELRSYLDIETDDNVARGMPLDAARRAAHLKLGNTVRIREEIYRLNSVGPIETFGRDVRLALRGIRRRPGFTLAVVLTLAVGIGANTTMFGVIDGVLLKPLPYPDPEQLVSIEHVAPGLTAGELRLSPTQYFTYRDEGRVFQQIGLYGDGGRTITGAGEPEQARALFVTSEVFQALRVKPQLGRLFTEADVTPGGVSTGRTGGRPYAPVVLLTHAYWQRRFGGDPSIIGRRLIADASPVEVIGVMPEGFRFLDMQPAAEVISLLTFDPDGMRIGGFNYHGLARLKPGVTPADANADITRMLPIWLNAWPTPPNTAGRPEYERWKIAPVVQPLKDDVVGSVGDMLWILTATIGMVLLIACANVANLMLVRSEARRQEFAVRTALGARRRDIVREVLVESLALSSIGGVMGVGLAYLGLRVVVATAPTTLPRAENVSLDPRAIAFALIVSLISSLLFGALPALRHAAHHATPVSTRGASGGRERQRTRHALVVVQVAIALVLLVGSGLMIRTFVALIRVEPGFAPTADVQTARVWVPPPLVAEPERVTRMQQEMLDKIASLPGVTAAAFASAAPLEGPVRVWTQPVYVEGRRYPAGTTPPPRRMKTVSPGYFRAIGTRLIAGRDIAWTDIYGHRPVVIVSENFAREHWGSATAALGHRLRDSLPTSTDAWRSIVGVVQDVHEDALHEAAPAFVYWPTLMEHFSGNALFTMRAINLIIRGDVASHDDVLRGVRNAVWSVNPQMPVFLTRTMRDLYAASMARTSFALTLLVMAAATALTLGIIGIYGVIAYVVAQRSREIGIRLALGAAPLQLKQMFVRQGLALTAVGAGVGLVTAMTLTRWMSTLLFGVERLDPPTYAAVLGVLGTAAALASYLPARRAAGVDPVETLMTE
jgi:predicted permease